MGATAKHFVGRFLMCIPAIALLRLAADYSDLKIRLFGLVIVAIWIVAVEELVTAK